MITRAARGHWSMVDRGLRYQMYTLCPIQHPLPRFLWFLFQVYGCKWRPFWIVHTHPLVVSPSAYKHPRTFALTTKMKVIQYSNIDSSTPLVTADQRGLSASSVNTCGRMAVAPLSDVAATTLSVMRSYMRSNTIRGVSIQVDFSLKTSPPQRVMHVDSEFAPSTRSAMVRLYDIEKYDR
jgi:hypothetical protein